MQRVKLFIAAAGCGALLLAGTWAAADRSVYNQVKTTAGTVVNRAAKQDRLDAGRLALAFDAAAVR